VRTDWASLIEEWGKRFFAEMDYVAEAASAQLFESQMSQLPGIMVPGVYENLTNHEVLVTEWIEGATVISAASSGLALCISSAAIRSNAMSNGTFPFACPFLFVPFPFPFPLSLFLFLSLCVQLPSTRSVLVPIRNMLLQARN